MLSSIQRKCSKSSLNSKLNVLIAKLFLSPFLIQDWVDTTVKKEDLAKYFCCSTILEEEVANAYQIISSKVLDTEISYLLEYIAKDSFKHAVAFKALSAQITEREYDVEECTKLWGKLWKNIVEDTKTYTSKKEITLIELSSIIKDLESCEKYVGEEFLTILYTKVIQLLAEDEGVDLNGYKSILEWIIEDEKRHSQILEIIKQKIDEKISL